VNNATRIALDGHRATIRRLELYASCDHVDVRRGDGWLAVATGVASNDMNGVVSDESFGYSAQTVDELVTWFVDLALPASWFTVVPDEQLTAALIQRHARPERTGWWAGRTVANQRALQQPIADISIRRVRTDEDLEQWLDVAANCGWIDDSHDRQVRGELYSGVGLDHPNLAHWIAARDQTAIGMASSFVDDDVIDLCNLAVLEPERRSGVGTALVERRLLEGARRNASRAVSALSPDGWKLYQALGFASAPVIPDACFYLPLATD
jgi:GNAT superfamily N-acetyltransferase